MLARLPEIWSLRHFWLALARHDLQERYRRSLLGIAWSLIKPAGMTALLTLVFANVFDVAILDYAPFLFLGLVCWQFLSESVLQGCHSYRLGATYLRVRPAPIAIFPLRIVLSAGVHAGIGLLAAVLAVAWLKGIDRPAALLAMVPALVVFLFTAWSLACLCGILNTLYSDTQQVAEITLQALFYATPVIYLPESLPPSGWLRLFVDYNPFAALLSLIRRPILLGESASLQTTVLALVFMACLSLLACWSVNRAERRMILWL